MRKILNICISMLFSGSVYYYTNSIGFSIMSFAFAITSFEIKKDRLLIPYLFSTLFSIIYLIGFKVYNDGDVFSIFNSIKDIIGFIMSIISMPVVLGNYVSFIFDKFEKIENIGIEDKKNTNILTFIILVVIIFVSVLPVLVVYYPGIESYDEPHQLEQINSNSYDKFYPPIHTYFINFCMKLQNIIKLNYLTIYSLLQMAIMSVCYAYLILTLIKRKAPKWLVGISIFFYSVNPIISIFTIITTKDIIFGGLCIILSCFLLEFIHDSHSFGILKCLILGLVILLSCLFRNNMIYAMFIFVVIMMVIILKSELLLKRKLILSLTFILPVILYFIINGPIYKCIGIKEGNNREKLSVPMQQMAYVACNEKISETDKKEIDKFVPYEKIEGEYNLRFADPIKNFFNTEYYNKNKKEFFKLYFRLFLKYPKDYINAFLQLNIPYWYIDAESVDKYSKRDYIEDYNYLNYDVTVERMNNSKMPLLFRYYHNIANYKIIKNVPVLKMVCSIALPIWILIFVMFILIYKKRYKELIVILPCILLWCTYLLGPVSNFRYIFPIYVLYPLYLYLLIDNKRSTYEKN